MNNLINFNKYMEDANLGKKSIKEIERGGKGKEVLKKGLYRGEDMKAIYNC